VHKRLKQLAVEYGAVFIVIYLTIFTVVWVGFWAAIKFGWSSDSTAANVGVWTAAYLATKLTQPLRIIASAAVTPPVARLYDRFFKRPAASNS
jgi:ABC-type siderophore export system fused ATPase/permease subunit